MKDFLYQIKGKDTECGFGNWGWPPIFTGMVTAPDKKAAKALVEEEYGRSFPTRVLHKDLESNEFLLGLKEIATDDHYTRRLFEVQSCKRCQKPFKVIEKYTFNSPGGGPGFCSSECAREWDQANGNFLSSEPLAGHHPVIYCITNRSTGMCYVGKTRQVFTLRWYQHFFQPAGTKFHQAIKESPVTDWVFEVLEVVVIPEEVKGGGLVEVDRYVCAREKEWINKRNSAENGYNTVGATTENESGSLFGPA